MGHSVLLLVRVVVPEGSLSEGAGCAEGGESGVEGCDGVTPRAKLFSKRPLST